MSIEQWKGVLAALPMGFAGQGDIFEYSWPPIGDRVFEYASDRLNWRRQP